MKDVMILLFATTGGLALSGISANLYRLLVRKEYRKSLPHCIVMIFAGPSVLVENSTKSFRAKKCTRLSYGVAIAVSGYWCFSLGLLLIQLGMWSHVLHSSHGLPH